MATIGARKPTALLVAALASGIPVEAPSAEAQALYTQMEVPPSAGRRVVIDRQTIRPLQATGIWTKLDAVYLMAAHDSQAARLNAKSPGTWTLTATNSPTFTADRGYQGDGASSYLTASGYNPSTAGGGYSQDSATFGAYVQTVSTVVGGYELFLTNGTGRIQVGAGLNNYTVRVNDVTNLSTGAVTPTGHFAAKRTSSGAKSVWRNGSQLASDSSASTTVTTALGLLANINAVSNFSSARVSAAYTAGGVSDAEMVLIDSILRNYMQAVGAA